MTAAKFLLAILLSIMVSGCVLQSAAPLFSEGQAKLALGSAGVTMASYSWKQGAWVKEPEAMALKVEGQHYVAKDEDSTVAITFVPLRDGWYALQATEVSKPATYMLAKIVAGGAVLHMLSCSELKKRPALDGAVDYKGDDCFVRPGTGAMALFENLAAEPGPPAMKLEPVK